MNYLINPIWFYLISLVDNVRGITIVAVLITVMAAGVVAIWTDDTSVFGSPQEEIIVLKKKNKKICYLICHRIINLNFCPKQIRHGKNVNGFICY